MSSGASIHIFISYFVNMLISINNLKLYIRSFNNDFGFKLFIFFRVKLKKKIDTKSTLAEKKMEKWFNVRSFIVAFSNLFVLSIKIKNVHIWLLFNMGLLENDVTESTFFVTDSNHWFYFQWDLCSPFTRRLIFVVFFFKSKIFICFYGKLLTTGLLSFSKFEHLLLIFFLHKHNGIGH